MDHLRHIAQHHPQQHIEVWFQDEARFGQQGTLTRKWARRGSRPPAVKQTQYDSLYVIGAACPQAAQTVGLLSPELNTAMINRFFEQFQQEVDPHVHVVMIWDQAGYHCSKQLRLPKNLTVLALPPYSPELKPIENLWHYLRSHYWPNRSYDDDDALRQAACDAWQATCLDPQIIKSVCNAPYLTSRRVKS